MKIRVQTAEFIYGGLHFMDTREVLSLYEKYAYRYANLQKRKSSKKARSSAAIKFRLRVWEHLKACVKELKDRGRWDNVLKQPIPTEDTSKKPLWVALELEPGTDKWKEHWKRYPHEQTSMAKHTIRMNKKEMKRNEQTSN